jgi:hypothetical protein
VFVSISTVGGQTHPCPLDRLDVHGDGVLFCQPLWRGHYNRHKPYRQHRFCNTSNNDSFPVTGGGEVASVKGGWNSTVWAYFSTADSKFRACMYPCFNTGGILRSPDHIIVIPFPEILPSNFQYWGVGITAALVYVCVPLTMLFCLALLILNIGSFSVPSWDFALRIKEKAEGRYKLAFRHLAWGINAYAKILTPLILVVFVIWVEWTITLDIQPIDIEMLASGRQLCISVWSSYLLSLADFEVKLEHFGRHIAGGEEYIRAKIL